MSTYMISKPDEEIRGKSVVFAVMKKIIGENEVESAINRIAFTKDKKVSGMMWTKLGFTNLLTKFVSKESCFRHIKRV